MIPVHIYEIIILADQGLKSLDYMVLNSMLDLEEKLKEAEGARMKLIVTDGVFSMDGKVAPLK